MLGHDLFFENLVYGYVNGRYFIERPWLVKEVEAALAEPDCRFLLLTAEPGAGKTVFVASLANSHRDWMRYFLRRDQRTLLADPTAKSFLITIGYQMATLFPELFSPTQIEISVQQRIGELAEGAQVVGVEVKRWLSSPFYKTALEIKQRVEQNQGQIPGIKISNLVTDPRLVSLGDLQYMALFDAAKVLLQVDPNKNIIILIDALDELRYQTSETTLLDWFAECPELPPNLRFILTSRSDEVLLYKFKTKQQRWLIELPFDPRSINVKNDSKSYITHFLASSSANTALLRNDIAIEEFTEHLAALSAGNFAYLDAVFRGIDKYLAVGDDKYLDRLLHLQDLPPDLGEFYAFVLRQIQASVSGQSIELIDEMKGTSYSQPVWSAVYIPLLMALAVAREPLSIEQIARYCNLKKAQPHLMEAVSRLSQFLESKNKQHRFFHNSFSDFFTSNYSLERFPEFFLDPAKAHSMICDAILDAIFYQRSDKKTFSTTLDNEESA